MADSSEGEVLSSDFVPVSGDSLEAQLSFLNNLRERYNGHLIYLAPSDLDSGFPPMRILNIEGFSSGENCFLKNPDDHDSLLYITFLDYWMESHQMPFGHFLHQLVDPPASSS